MGRRCCQKREFDSSQEGCHESSSRVTRTWTLQSAEPRFGNRPKPTAEFVCQEKHRICWQKVQQRTASGTAPL